MSNEIPIQWEPTIARALKDWPGEPPDNQPDVLSKLRVTETVSGVLVTWMDRSLHKEWCVGTALHAEDFEAKRTTSQYISQAEMEEFVRREIARRLRALRERLSCAVLRARPEDWGGMCGIATWPSIVHKEHPNPGVYVNAGGIALDKARLDGLARNLWLDEHADYNQGAWHIICHPLTTQHIHDFDISYRTVERDDTGVGFHVDHFDAKIGKTFPIISDRYMPKDAVLLANLDAMSYGYHKDYGLQCEDLAGRYPQLSQRWVFRSWVIYCQTYGVVVQKPRANIGMIYDLVA